VSQVSRGMRGPRIVAVVLIRNEDLFIERVIRNVLDFCDRPARRFSDFGRDVLPAWLADGVPLYGWPLPAVTFLVDVGTPESYARAEREWRRP
jgi:NDP-sugar pyrophosphorylase family protein